MIKRKTTEARKRKQKTINYTKWKIGKEELFEIVTINGSGKSAIPI